MAASFDFIAFFRIPLRTLVVLTGVSHYERILDAENGQ